jgi:phospholipase/lecithinase/hemolysin
VKAFIRFTWFTFLFGFAVVPAQAAFTSLYIFGDGVSTTTNNTQGPAALYYGLRYCNGRVWLELLAQQLNLTNNFWYSNNVANHLSYANLSATSTNWSNSSNNWSFFGDFSPVLVTNVNRFAASDAATALTVVWVNDADFVGYMNNSSFSPFNSNNIAIWTNGINQSISNHLVVITNLYARGARTLLMPNAVDITEVPFYSARSAADKSFVRQRIFDFNAGFASMLSNAMVSCPGLKIYEPDFFSLLDNILTNAASYGLTNALLSGHTVDAVNAYYNYGMLPNINLNGPGANYIFWDNLDPSAKAQAVMVQTVQRLLASPQISQITSQNGTNQLHLMNVPVGLNGIVLGSASLGLTNWTTVTSVNSTNSVLPVFVPISSPMQFYRLNFPFSWTWP